MNTVRLTTAQALVRAMAAQHTLIDGVETPIFAGVWAIFGHGNVAGLGEALHGARDTLPTWRAHNEQGMALAAIAYAKASRRRRFMAVTTSIGPGALNLVTASAVAHVNRLPILLLPGDVFASRRPDPVLQQIENWSDATVSANDALRSVSRYFDRIARPEQLVASFGRAMQVLTDPAQCGPATLALCQDVQAEAYDFPLHLFATRVWRHRRALPDPLEVAHAAELLRTSRKPFIVSGGGVLYAGAERQLADFARARGIPVGETQAGKSALPADHPCNMGGIGVTGTEAANARAAEADLILAIGTRLADFTTGSRVLFQEGRLVGLNVLAADAGKHGAASLVADAGAGLSALDAALGDWRAPEMWTERAAHGNRDWFGLAAHFTEPAADADALPSDAQVIGAVQRRSEPNDVIVCAAGGLPGELQKLWQARRPGGYHMEYGFSCMGYEIAGGLGVKMADPSREVVVMVGDGSYLMLNSEIATSVMLGFKIILVVLDNRGFGCINRLQIACGGAPFNNLLADTIHETLPAIDFAAHAASLGARSEHVVGIGALDAALSRARESDRTYAIVIETDPVPTTHAGGRWWDVAVPQISVRPEVEQAHAHYRSQAARQFIGNRG